MKRHPPSPIQGDESGLRLRIIRAAELDRWLDWRRRTDLLPATKDVRSRHTRSLEVDAVPKLARAYVEEEQYSRLAKESREKQGLPAHITDPVLLRKIAALMQTK